MTRRLLLSYLGVTIVVLALLEVPLGVFYAQREEERFIAAVERDAVVLASFYEDALEGGFTPPGTQAVDYADRTGARIIVVDDAGISVLDTAGAAGRDYSTRPEIAEALSGTRSAGIRRSDTLDTDLVYVAVPVASGGVVHGALRSTIDAGEVARRIQRFRWGLVAVATVVLVAVTGIGWAIARTVTKPIRTLERSALRFADGDLRPVDIGDDAAPEVRSLGGSMNAMAARLDELIASQRAFVGDASHQLRTPLTAVRLRLENLDAHIGDDAGRAELEGAIAELERLGELVEALLLLARAERRTVPEPVDVATLASDRVDTWTAVAAERGVVLERTGVTTAWALAVPGGVEQILDNVIDNALSVSPAGATVSVDLAVTDRGADGDTVVLSVIDRGPGLNDADKARATERFWRSDQNRRGSGLGLAIAAALVEAGGGELQLVDTPGGGLTVRSVMPGVADQA